MMDDGMNARILDVETETRWIGSAKPGPEAERRQDRSGPDRSGAETGSERSGSEMRTGGRAEWSWDLVRPESRHTESPDGKQKGKSRA